MVARCGKRKTALGLTFLFLGGCNLVFGVQEGVPRPTLDSDLAPIYTTTADVRRSWMRAEAGDEPWATASSELTASADSALTLTPLSVVDDGPGANETNPHTFATDAPSDAEGCEADPDGGRHDYCAALTMSRAALELALQFAATADDRYAHKAIDLLHHWFVAPDTAMHPAVENLGPKTAGLSSGAAIEISLVVPSFIYAASFVRQHPHWAEVGETAEAAFDTWISDYLALSENTPIPTGASSAFYALASRSAAAAHLNRAASLEEMWALWRARVTSDIEPSGVLSGMTAPSVAWFVLKGVVLTAELAAHRGENLYGEPALKRALDAYAPCAIPDAPTCPIAETLDAVGLAEGASLYELTYSQYQEPGHLAVIEASGRPVRDVRVLGPVTFTHGNAFER